LCNAYYKKKPEYRVPKGGGGDPFIYKLCLGSKI